MQSSLVSEFAETCGNDAGLGKLGIMESCAVEGGNFEKLTDINSVHVMILVLLELTFRYFSMVLDTYLTYIYIQ